MKNIRYTGILKQSQTHACSMKKCKWSKLYEKRRLYICFESNQL